MKERPRARERVFTRNFVLVSLATFAQQSGHHMSQISAPLLLQLRGFPPLVVGGWIGAFAFIALLTRLPVGAAIARFGTQRVSMTGSVLVVIGMSLYVVQALVPEAGPAVAGMPLLLVLALLAHAVGFSVYGTSANTFVADIVAPARRGEAIGYYGILQTTAGGLSAGVAIPLIAAFGMWSVFFVSACGALIASLLTRLQTEVERPGRAEAGRVRGLERDVIVPALLNGSFASSVGAARAFVVLLGLERGIENPGIYFTAQALSSVLLRVVSGRAADRFGRLAAIVPGALLVSAALVMVGQAETVSVLLWAGIIYGIGSAIAQPALQALVIDRVGAARRGPAMATYLIAADLGVSGGSTMGGQIASLAGYAAVFPFLAAGPLLGMAALLAEARVRGVSLRPHRIGVEPSEPPG